MADMDRRYYLAAGEDEKTIRDFFQSRADAFKAAEYLAESFGGKAVTQGRYMPGVLFDDDTLPHGWRQVGSLPDGQKYYTPIRRSKIGKATSDAIREIQIPGAPYLHSKFSQDGGVFGESAPHGGFFIAYITAEIIDGKCILRVPDTMEFEPKNSTTLKKSEYWAIREAADTLTQREQGEK